MEDLIAVLGVSIAVVVPVVTLLVLYRIPPRWVSDKLEQTPEMLGAAIKSAYPLEDIAKVITASAINTAKILSADDEFAPKVMKMAQNLTPIAVNSYLSQNPGRDLANMRHGNPRGSVPIPKPGQGGGAWWEPIAQQLVANYAGRMLNPAAGGDGTQNHTVVGITPRTVTPTLGAPV